MFLMHNKHNESVPCCGVSFHFLWRSFVMNNDDHGTVEHFCAKLIATQVDTPFLIWKRVCCPHGPKSSSDISQLLRKSHSLVLQPTYMLLGKIPASAEEIDVDLVKVTTRELGVTFGVRYSRTELWSKAFEQGLMPVPHVVVPFLRAQYKDQPEGECLIIGMDPISDERGRLNLLSLGCLEGKRRVDTYCATSSDSALSYWYGISFVFMKRRYFK